LAYIPEHTISTVRNAADIVDVVSDVVIMKKAGQNHVGLCPFHSEKTPSFTVSPQKQIFYCFGCGAGGDVFNFLMKYENYSFPEAVKALARRYGIEVSDQTMTPEQRQRISEKEKILEINGQAAQFFHKNLMENPSGKAALDYLTRRGQTRETILVFTLGYAPDGWDYLLSFFNKQGTPAHLLQKAGLIIPRKSGTGFYDRFRNRIMFPIRDARMQVVGFGGRVMDDSLPKYLNSPETAVFNKSRSVYGIDVSRQHCRAKDTVYITEGYFDAISLYGHGIKNVAATLGTALTPDHVRLLKGHARQAVLVYDSDQAGIQAALKSMGVFRQEKMDAKVLVLPEGHDPDSFVNDYGAEAFEQAAEKSLGMMVFLTEAAVRKYGLTVEGKLRIISAMKIPLASIEDHLARSLYIRELAERIGVEEVMILEKLRHEFPKDDDRNSRQHSQMKPAQEPGPPMPRDGWKTKLERQMVAMMLQYPESIREIERRNTVDFFENPFLREISQTVLAHQGRPVSEILNAIQDERARALAAELVIGDETWKQEACVTLLDRFERSRQGRRARMKHNYLKEIQAAEAVGDRRQRDELMGNYNKTLMENGRV
jgi:DNA primase